MKIIIAPDKFKNSLTGLQFCDIVESAITALALDLEILKLPLADGGDGTIEVADYYLNGSLRKLTVNNPFFQPVEASYLYANQSKTAFIEMAEASGVKLLRPDELDCKNATTFGVGEMIADALSLGATNIILGIGGSATNDCGMGMATALGYRFLDKNNKAIEPIGANLSKVDMIDSSGVNPKLKVVDFKIACDVTNPLYGKNGAAHIYASQKGASIRDIEMLDLGLRDFSKIIDRTFRVASQSIEGAGAAGGMGIAAKVFLDGNLYPGIEIIKELAKFDSKLKNTGWVITGEGKLDSQTLTGKTISGVLASAKANNINVAVFCGDISLSQEELKALGVHYSDCVMNYAEDLNDAMEHSSKYLQMIAQKFAKKYVT